MVIETPFDAVLLQVYQKPSTTATASVGEDGLALVGQTVLHLDDRFFRGRECALPIHDTHGSEQGLLEVVACWKQAGST